MNNDDRSFFDARAETWDQDNPVPREKLIRILDLCDIQPGQDILDVGTGTGRLIPLLLERVGPEGSICGLDPSGGMLSVARRRHNSPNLRFIQSPAELIPFTDSSFDLALCYSVFPHFEDPPGAIREMVRILKPSGSLVIAHTEGREAINARHRSAGRHVANDILPPADEVSQLLTRQPLRIQKNLDRPDFFFVSAIKRSARVS